MIPLEVTESKEQAPLTLVIYGKPKIGKTEVLAQLKDFLMLDFENGSNHVSALKQKIIGFYPPIKESEQSKKDREKNKEMYFQEFGQELLTYRATHSNPYKGAIVDTITALEGWCEDDATWEYMGMPQGKSFNRIKGKEGIDKITGDIINVVSSNKFQSVLTLPNGAGYLHLRNSFKKWKGKFDKIAEYKIFVAHIKDIFLTRDGKDVSASDLDLTGKIKNITCAGVDAIGQVYRTFDNPLELRISFQNHNQDLVGSRAKHLRNQDFVLAVNNPDGSIKSHNWDKVYI